jgi:hypothetical protein
MFFENDLSKNDLSEAVGFTGFEGRYKVEKDVPISSAELKAIEIATNFIFQQDVKTNKGLGCHTY